MGTPSFSAIIFEQLLSFEKRGLIELVCVVTRPDRPEGRRKQLTPSKLKQALLQHNKLHLLLETAQVKKECALLAEKKPDLLLVAAFGQILSEEVLSLGRLGCWNVHTSILPKLRGAAPIQRAVLSGMQETGVTIMHVVKALDAGAIFAQEKVPITPFMTYGELELELVKQSEGLLCKLFNQARESEREKQLLQLCIQQEEYQVTWAEKIEKEEARIDLNRSNEEVCRKICGLDPKPGAFASFSIKKDDSNGKGSTTKRIKFFGVLEAQPAPVEKSSRGTIAIIDGAIRGIYSADGWFCPKFVQPEGSKRMSFDSWLRGMRGKEEQLSIH